MYKKWFTSYLKTVTSNILQTTTTAVIAVIYIIVFYRVFLAKQFESLQPHLESLIPMAKRAFLSQFYSQVISILGSLILSFTFVF